jgi:putative acetyltransferase
VKAVADIGVNIRVEPPGQPEVIALIDELDAYQKPLYPAESHHGIDLDALSQPNVVFAVARTAGGEAVGCAAFVAQEDGWAELKRMFVRPSHRGSGMGRALIAFLEAEAMSRSIAVMRLETGPLQPEALRAYERAGYVRRGPFGGYGPDPNSVFMQKRLKETRR